MTVQGIENMSADQLRFEIQRGAKIVYYQYCISLLVITFRRSSGAYYIPAGQSAVSKGLPWTVLSLLMGWWGIPWGPIFTIQALITNFKGGKDITAHFSGTAPSASSGPAVMDTVKV